MSVLVVAAILFGGIHLTQQFKDFRFQKLQLPEVEKTVETMQGTGQSTLVTEYELQVERLRQATADQIADELEKLRREKEILEKMPRASTMSYFDLAKAVANDKLRQAIESDIRLEVLKQKGDALAKLQRFADKAKSYNDLKIEVAHLREMHSEAIKLREQNKLKSWRIAKENPRTYRLPGTPAYSEIEKVRAEWVVLNKNAWDAYNAWKTKSDYLARSSSTSPTGTPRFRVDQSKVLAALKPVRDTVEKYRKSAEGQYSHIVSSLWSAFYIVLGALCTGVLLKAVMFFVLAPLATRRPPVTLLPQAFKREEQEPDGERSQNQFRSEVSLELALEANSELLVKSDYLQRVSDSARTTTKFLLNGRYPIASLASGMYLLTRVQPTVDDTAVISSTKDALSKIARIELADGETFVLQPHHLAGIVHSKNSPVNLFSMWRFGSLHSWLTLQFRYLVFRGPVTLVVKGCQGVRIEQAQSGRAISQAATIGFSANLGYSTVRSETFMAYLLGHKALFNDRFSGVDGYFAYQEIPSTDQRSGVTGRSLQGLMDGLLKAFGI